MEYIMDMVCFKNIANDYIVKEVAIISLNEDLQPLVFLFEPPFPWEELSDKYKKKIENLCGIIMVLHGIRVIFLMKN